MAINWLELLTGGWHVVVTGGVGGTVFATVTKGLDWKRTRRLRVYAKGEAQKYRDALKAYEGMGGDKSPNAFTRLSAAMGHLKATTDAYREAGDKVEAIELEKEAGGWERLQKAQEAGLRRPLFCDPLSVVRVTHPIARVGARKWPDRDPPGDANRRRVVARRRASREGGRGHRVGVHA